MWWVSDQTRFFFSQLSTDFDHSISSLTIHPPLPRPRPARRVAAAMAAPPPAAAVLASVTLAERVAPVTLLRRYKRFLADVRLDSSDTITTVHCPNTGPMTGLLAGTGDGESGVPAFVSRARPSTTRKYAHTLEAVHPPGEPLVGIHSAAANKVVAALAESGALAAALAPWVLSPGPPRREVAGAYGRGSTSRPDFVFGCDDGGGDAVVEVKSVTLAGGGVEAPDAHTPAPTPPPPPPRLALFPDTVSVRATKHAGDLAAVARAGRRAAALFLIQRGDCPALAPAIACDPAYAAALADAADAGVRLVGLAGGVRFDAESERLIYDFYGAADVVLPPPEALAKAAAEQPAAKKARKRK